MEKILVSACLLGEKCRYDGNDNLSEAIKALGSKYDLVPFCPEVESGLGTPRKPVEIFHGMAKRQDGSDVTSFFNDGAQKAPPAILPIKARSLATRNPMAILPIRAEANPRGNLRAILRNNV
jgi:uncharacterized protein YbbK (DUF523 family)